MISLRFDSEQLLCKYHPGIILTWTRGRGSRAWLRPRSAVDREAALEVLKDSPFAKVVIGGASHVRMSLGQPEWESHRLLQELADDGFVDYVATSTELPDGARQVISVATRLLLPMR